MLYSMLYNMLRCYIAPAYDMLYNIRSDPEYMDRCYGRPTLN